jgi:hypothetical protein
MKQGPGIGLMLSPGKRRSSTAPVIPELIEITTTLTGDFSIGLDGTSGDVTVTWPDLTTDVITLIGGGNTPAANKTLAGGGVITISNPDLLTLININEREVTNIIIPDICINLVDISITGNLLTSFTTHPEWVNIQNIAFQNNLLTSFTTHPEWVNIQNIVFQNNLLTSFTTHPEWVNIQNIAFQNNLLTSFTTHPEWVNIQNIVFENNLLTSFTTHPEWVNLKYLAIYNNQLTSFIAHPEWVLLEGLDISYNQILTFITHPEWVNLLYIYVNDTLLTSFIAHVEWINITEIYIHNNAITSFITFSEWINLIYGINAFGCALTETSVNNILIEADASGIASTEENTITIDLSGGTNATPTGAGITAFDALIVKGVAAACNGYPV